MEAPTRPQRRETQSSARHNARSRAVADWLSFALLAALPLAATVWGFSYYASPAEERVRSALHSLLKPSGLIGQSFGLAALGMFLFMWLYPIRKAFRWLSRVGALSNWLRVHVVIGLGLPVIAGAHAGWRFHGIVGLGYLAMVIVCMSGIIGRYLYSRIPRRRDGLDMTREEVVNRRRTLVTEIAAALERMPVEVEHALDALVQTPTRHGVLASLRGMLTDDIRRRRALRSLRDAWCAPRAGRQVVDPRTLNQALALASQEIRLHQQMQLLDVSQRIFHYWHVAHRPFAITALVAVLVHVIVAFYMGQTWLG